MDKADLLTLTDLQDFELGLDHVGVSSYYSYSKNNQCELEEH